MIPTSSHNNIDNSVFNEEMFKNKLQGINTKGIMEASESKMNIITNESDDEYNGYNTDNSDDDYKCFDNSEYERLQDTTETLIKLIREQSVNCSEKVQPYTYAGLELLTTDLHELLSSTIYNNENLIINICSYHVNLEGKHPFLQFFLLKNDKEEFIFPSFKYTNHLNVITKSLAVMNIVCRSYYKINNSEFKGGYRNGQNLYLFFDCSILMIESVRLTKINDLWLILIDEIVNSGSVLNYKISEGVVDFFKNNPEFLYLKNTNYDFGFDYCDDDNRKFIETPVVVYNNCPKKKLNFISTFGISHSTSTALFGPYYYFTNYDMAIKNTTNEGIIRSAIFLGNMKVVLNKSSDPVDDSEITNNIINSYNNTTANDANIQFKMRRIADRGGLWTINFDSVYLGRVKLDDDGLCFENGPLWVIKDYIQQLSLSSHVINK